MSLQLTFEIELLSDYHVSAGHGFGPLVDSALHRDMDGVPVLRGTTLTGLLRDGLYRLAQLDPVQSALGSVPHLMSDGPLPQGEPAYCGQDDPSEADCPVCRIFGSPRTTKRWRIGSARPADLGAASGQPIVPHPDDEWGPSQAGALVAPHVRVSPRTRRAEARKLFFREEGDQRLRFIFTVACDEDTAEALDEAAWLVAAARFVRHLGAGRRRGRGECCIHLRTATGQAVPSVEQLQPGATHQDYLLNRFAHRILKQPEVSVVRAIGADQASQATATPTETVTAASSAAKPITAPLPAPSPGKPVRLLLIARLDEPLIVSQKAEAGNEFHTLDYIPGATLRGALAARVAGRHDLTHTTDPVYHDFVRLFCRGEVVFPTLYPAYREPEDTTRIFPTIVAPQNLLTCELFPGYTASSGPPEVHGVQLAASAWNEDPTCAYAGCGAALKPLTGFVALPPELSQTPGQRVEVRRTTEMHVRIDPQSGRAAEGNLFGFDALAPGQYFVGEMTCASQASWDTLRRLAGLPAAGEGFTLRLGKANRRGYGQTTLYVSDTTDAVEHLVLVPIAQRVVDPEALVLTLLTDTIVVDAWGRCQGDFRADWLTQALGCPVRIGRGFAGRKSVDGFNSHLGLPRWRDMALTAGSSVTLSAPGVDLQALQRHLSRVEREGIGLRRHEGYGRVVFNHPIYNHFRGVASTAIDLPDDKPNAHIRLGDGRQHPLHVEAAFEPKWASYLDAQTTTEGWCGGVFRKAEFETLARVLRTTPFSSSQAVKAQLDRLGHTTELLTQDLVNRDLAVREADKAQRTFFAEHAGRAGRHRVEALVTEMEDRIQKAAAADSQRLWRLGLGELADRIAAEARVGRE